MHLYDNMNPKAEKFDGKESLQDKEVFKTPKSKFNQAREKAQKLKKLGNNVFERDLE